MSWYVTDHAVDRFLARCGAAMSWSAARRAIKCAMRRPVTVERRGEAGGGDCYRIRVNVEPDDRRECVAVVRGGDHVVTVLPGDSSEASAGAKPADWSLGDG